MVSEEGKELPPHLGQSEEWLEDERNTVAVIKKCGVKVELNTSYFKFGNEPYPAPRIMKMLAEANVPVLISDDAHSAVQLGNHFATAENMAKECGIKHWWNPLGIKSAPAHYSQREL